MASTVFKPSVNFPKVTDLPSRDSLGRELYMTVKVFSMNKMIHNKFLMTKFLPLKIIAITIMKGKATTLLHEFWAILWLQEHLEPDTFSLVLNTKVP